MKKAPPQVLRTYAKSLLESGKEEEYDVFAKALFILSEFLNTDRNREIIFNPVIPKEEKQAVLVEILKKEKYMNENFERFLTGVFEKQRERILPELSKVFDYYLSVKRKITTAIVYSAQPLKKDGWVSIKSGLDGFFKKHGYSLPIEYQFLTDVSLIGGLKVFIDDYILDLSIQGQLKKVQQYLISQKR